MQSGLHNGKLITWKDDRGFGFIQPTDGGQDVFLHISEIRDATRRPQENDIIYYRRIVDSDGKIRACNAFIVGARKKSAAFSEASTMGNAQPPKAIESAFPIGEVILISFLPLLGAAHFTLTTGNILPIVLYPVMSLVTYALYADDKSRAQRKDWRIPEQSLHLCELLGGWIGGFIAQRTLRHKSRKKSYQVEFWAVIIIHYIAWLFWLFLGRTLWP
jgi:uncharacterized membrane protein YsdA (DUF1294 family)/cold shock CspA family protein